MKAIKTVQKKKLIKLFQLLMTLQQKEFTELIVTNKKNELNPDFAVDIIKSKD